MYESEHAYKGADGEWLSGIEKSSKSETRTWFPRDSRVGPTKLELLFRPSPFFPRQPATRSVDTCKTTSSFPRLRLPSMALPAARSALSARAFIRPAAALNAAASSSRYLRCVLLSLQLKLHYSHSTAQPPPAMMLPWLPPPATLKPPSRFRFPA